MKKTVVAVGILVLMGAGLAPAQEPAPLPPGSDFFLAGEPGQQPPQPPQPAIAPRAPMPPDLGKWWKNSEIVRELQLSDAQVNQLEAAFLDHRLRLIDLRAAVEREETRLQPMIEADQLDLAKVSAQLDVLLAARGKLEKENTMMMLSLRKVLTVDQWKKLQEIHQRHEGPMHLRGPRPPGEPREAPSPMMRKRMPGPGEPAPPPPPPVD